MNLKPSKALMDAHQWIDQLSEKQLVAIRPLFTALDTLMAASSPLQQSTGVASPSGSLATEPLNAVEDLLEQALTLEDQRTLHETLEKCLGILRSEKVRLAEASGEPALQTSSTVDGATGLPTRSVFERTLVDQFAEGNDCLVALFAVERLASINKRFGRVTGDRILLFVAQYLAQELPDSSSLSRWSGPGFAVILGAEFAAKKEEVQIRAIANKPLSTSIEVAGRSIMISVSCSCLLQRLSGNSAPDELFGKLDDFISAQLG